MLFKILSKDLRRNKTIIVILFCFIMISALLISSASNVILELNNSLDDLFTKSNAPHYVQMHTGSIDQEQIDQFVSQNTMVKDQLTSKALVIDGSNLFFNDSDKCEENSVMDAYFIEQNNKFDYLLDMKNEKICVSKGEVAVPIYYMQQKNLKIGDKIRISNGEFNKELKIVAFVRDVQMNPSIVSSKRFVVDKDDLEELRKNVGETEYLIEFQLNDLNDITKFADAYQSSQLPKQGTSIEYSLLKTLNALTDGIIAAIIIIISILIIVIALLTLRFIIIATMEEDYKEIGAMKAIGINKKYIRKIYMIKYVSIAAAASVAGYIGSLFLGKIFTSNIMIYMGSSKKGLFEYAVSFLSVIIVFLIVRFFTQIMLRRFNKVSVVTALRSGNMGESSVRKGISIFKNKRVNINILIGIKDVLSRTKMYILLLIVFFISSFIIIVPINMLNTLKSPEFITYMGIGRSDIRIDLHQSENVDEKFKEMINSIGADKDVDKFSPFVTCKYKALNSEGMWENINIETGEFSNFQLKYLEGKSPEEKDEIALSYLNAKDFDKKIGDNITIDDNGRKYDLKICGIYQDVTNGGRTAKARIDYNKDTVLWYVVSVDFKDYVNITEKANKYSKEFQSAQITYIEDYLNQTLGTTISQLQKASTVMMFIGVLITMLITGMFLKMLIAKDQSEIAIMKSLGFTSKNIKSQYLTRMIFVLIIGTVIGTVAANTLGENLISLIGASLGASKIQFVIDKSIAYVLCPITLMISVIFTTLICTASIEKIKIDRFIIE